MQSAYDRDEYVQIQWDHIATGKEHNFLKYNSNKVSHFNSTYDYGSVMHYSGQAFSKDGVATIVPLVCSFSYFGRFRLTLFHFILSFMIFIIFSVIE